MDPDDRRAAIVAAATPWGRAALAVVRLSGSDLGPVLERLVRTHRPDPLAPGVARRVDVVLGDDVVDDGVLVVGQAPHTYTGEHTAELTVHGNPVVVERVIEAALQAGARLARPGEFTRRAVVHGKLDLVQAEAVHQVIEAPTAAGARLARQGLEGALTAHFERLRQPLLDTAAELEARLDYPGDELALRDDAAIEAELHRVAERATDLAASHATGSVLLHGARVALVGAVNAGKSSLFNALVGRDRALVHERAGTTRDVLEVQTELAGLAVTLMDTAGERVTDDPIEAAGLALARELVAEADALIVVLRARPGGPDDTERQILDRTARRPRVVVLNGVDRPHQAARGAIPTVATAGRGLDDLTDALRGVLLGREPAEGDVLIASARQRDRLRAVAEHCGQAVRALPEAGVAVASECVLGALEELDALTGADTREAVLDALFARFCIGK